MRCWFEDDAGQGLGCIKLQRGNYQNKGGGVFGEARAVTNYSSALWYIERCVCASTQEIHGKTKTIPHLSVNGAIKPF